MKTTIIILNGEIHDSIDSRHVESYIDNLEHDFDNVEVSEWTDESVKIVVSSDEDSDDETDDENTVLVKSRNFKEHFGVELEGRGQIVLSDGFEWQVTDTYGDDTTLEAVVK